MTNNNGYLNIYPLTNTTPICVATVSCAANGLYLPRSVFDYVIANNLYGVAIGGSASGGGGTYSSSATGGITVNTNISDGLTSYNPLDQAESLRPPQDYDLGDCHWDCDPCLVLGVLLSQPTS